MAKEYTQFLEEVLKKASQIANEKYGKVSGTVKPGDNNQVLTEADLAIGQFIIGQIKIAYPKHNIIDEEAGGIDNGSDFTWVIDPIDGTSNFAAGTPLYGIMVGLLKGSDPIAGGISLPAFNEIYTAEKGSGAYCNGNKISVTAEQKLSSCLVAITIDGHRENPELTREETKLLAEIILEIRNLRASGGSFDTMMVAAGKYGALLNRTSKIWDNVAPQVILEEAGAVYTDFFGQPMDYSNPLQRIEQNFTQCTAPKIIHEQLQQIIHRNN